MTRASRLSRLGQRVFGDDWQRRLATEHSVDPTTVWRWSAGRSPIPQAVLVALFRSLGKRLPREPVTAAELDAMIDAALADK